MRVEYITSFYHYDGLGNVMDLTDINGDDVVKFRYSAFGEVFSGILSPYNHLGITGKEYDAKSGLMHYATRWYNPSVGRFIQPDSYKGKIYTPNQNNSYVYVGNNPINRIDPTGHESDLPDDMDWDDDGVMDSDQDDSDTFDQDDDGVADWNEDDTEDEWEYNDDTGWDWTGPGGSGGDDDDDDDDDNSPQPPPAYVTRGNEFNGQAGGVTDGIGELSNEGMDEDEPSLLDRTKAIGGGLLKTGFGALTVVGSGIGEVLSGGSLTVPMAVTAGFGANSVVGGVADMINSTVGNYDKVGKINLIKQGVSFTAEEVSSYITKNETRVEQIKTGSEFVVDVIDTAISAKAVYEGVKTIANKAYKLASKATNVIGKISYKEPKVTKAAKAVATSDVLYNAKSIFNNVKDKVKGFFDGLFK